MKCKSCIITLVVTVTAIELSKLEEGASDGSIDSRYYKIANVAIAETKGSKSTFEATLLFEDMTVTNNGKEKLEKFQEFQQQIMDEYTAALKHR